MTDTPSTIPKPQNKRRGLTRFIVPHRSFDWFVRGMIVTVLGTGGFIATSSWIYHRRLVQTMELLEIQLQPELLDHYTLLSVLGTGVVVLAAALYITLTAVFLFHRVAGPIYRFEVHMKQIIDGTPVDELRLRKGDQLQELCSTYNQLLHSLDLLEPKPFQDAEPQASEAGDPGPPRQT